MNRKKIAFLTGTRADYGKLKPLIMEMRKHNGFEISIIATGMHLLSEYGATIQQILEDNLATIHVIQNQSLDEKMEIVLSNTISNLSAHLDEHPLDLLVVHGDRVEALAGAVTSALRNVRIAHIEGGENSGTVDNLIRHSISKLSHFHFVSTASAASSLIEMGELPDCIYNIGSPDIDIMNSESLPTIDHVKSRYEIKFDDYGIVLFHPVTTEVTKLEKHVLDLCRALKASKGNFVVISPNNDYGSKIIRDALKELTKASAFRYIPSMRFEFFLSLLKHANFIIGNSSAGIREAPHFGVPTINVGSRQTSRIDLSDAPSIKNVDPDYNLILDAILAVSSMPRLKSENFGTGQAARNFVEVLENLDNWRHSFEKLK